MIIVRARPIITLRNNSIGFGLFFFPSSFGAFSDEPFGAKSREEECRILHCSPANLLPRAGGTGARGARFKQPPLLLDGAKDDDRVATIEVCKPFVPDEAKILSGSSAPQTELLLFLRPVGLIFSRRRQYPHAQTLRLETWRVGCGRRVFCLLWLVTVRKEVDFYCGSRFSFHVAKFCFDSGGGTRPFRLLKHTYPIRGRGSSGRTLTTTSCENMRTKRSRPVCNSGRCLLAQESHKIWKPSREKACCTLVC